MARVMSFAMASLHHHSGARAGRWAKGCCSSAPGGWCSICCSSPASSWRFGLVSGCTEASARTRRAGAAEATSARRALETPQTIGYGVAAG